MAEFWITASRYVQQVGQREPQYVQATPSVKALITLPDDFVPSKWDKNIYPKDKKPGKLRPAHADRTLDAVRMSSDPVDPPEPPVADDIEAKMSEAIKADEEAEAGSKKKKKKRSRRRAADQ
jgi:hypothetical protein